MRILFKHLSNFGGWKTKDKIIVFESDDWGSTRFKDMKTRDSLFMKYPMLKSAPMNWVDCLESNDDLEKLFSVIHQYKDLEGNHPVITALCNVANPDYEKIKNASFNSYYYEPFTDTLERYPNHEKVEGLYKIGIHENIFVPQYHGREHLHVNRWLAGLRSGSIELLDGFENEFWSFPSKGNSAVLGDLRAAFDVDNEKDLLFQRESNGTGLVLFKELFGYSASCFIAPNGPLNLSLEPALKESGILFIGGISKIQKEPLGGGQYKKHFHYLGKISKTGICFLTRNANFEPFKKGKDWVTSCMEEIDIAFKWNKPAIISSHRVNYIGGIDQSNREHGLKQLQTLLKGVLKKWPDVKFMTTPQLGNVILKSKEKGN